jgi:hypothetical protein
MTTLLELKHSRVEYASHEIHILTLCKVWFQAFMWNKEVRPHNVGGWNFIKILDIMIVSFISSILFHFCTLSFCFIFFYSSLYFIFFLSSSRFFFVLPFFNSPYSTSILGRFSHHFIFWFLFSQNVHWVRGSNFFSFFWL